ncbi:hypothetical protein TKWG_07720 [Advenella kashmirensis WT001]|uniref:Uncharacterized protein n=2 Tax=Advenella kashmirensis TaxID=310575 RepID=I3UAC3_ADVKW|nr:hypothetical protein TKWG_07720 [Advenella kashmirensis WT001]
MKIIAAFAFFRKFPEPVFFQKVKLMHFFLLIKAVEELFFTGISLPIGSWAPIGGGCAPLLLPKAIIWIANPKKQALLLTNACEVPVCPERFGEQKNGG